jgi:primosomal protein N' (replication factor Y) (superfamily II helicase)
VTPRVARVLPDVAALDRVFDYEIGDDEIVTVGDRVRVNLHGRSVRGWVVELAEDTEQTDLKPIARRLGVGPPPEVVELCEWAAWRWAGPWSRLLGSASAERLVHEVPVAPPSRSLPEVHNQQRVFGVRLMRHSEPTLLRVGPCTDPLELVLAALHGAEEDDRAGTVVVTTPTVAWASRLAERLRRRGVATAGPEQWGEAAAGPRVVVGARAAAFAPVPRLAAGVALDAHDGAYRQTQTPCWDAVAVLAQRCRRAGAPFVATSWCPDPVLSALVERTEAIEHEQRAWPRLVVADLAVADPRERGLSSVFVDAARRALADPVDGVRVAVVLQRLGGVRLFACKHCGALAVCERHGLALRESGEAYGCASGCVDLAKLCVTCGSSKLTALREGVGGLAKRVAALLGAPVAEVTAATTELPADARIVVGTEAVLTRVRHAAVVCFAELDDYLSAPRAHASLEALRAIGLAGRLVGARGAASPGVVVVQTRLASHPVVLAAVHGSAAGVVADEVASAAALGLPPHVALCALSGEGAADYAVALRAAGLEVNDEVERHVAIATDHERLCDVLRATPRPAARVRVEVDPLGG